MALPHKWTADDILTLTYIRGLNSNTLRQIVERYESLETLLNSELPPQLAAKIFQGNLFADSLLKTLREQADKQKELCDKANVYIVSFWDNDYPELLKHINYPPLLLFVRGRLEASDSNAIGIVGTRKCTMYGKLTTERFADVFAKNGIIVCSGLAYGIDTIAHSATLKAQGITYAVIASGIDQISPSLSAKLAHEISGAGAVISEYRCGTKALPAYFPQRNRIISGISRATVVIESALKGGALITAQFALDQGREIFAVPGNINSEKSEGTNKLIRKNIAMAALSPEDVLEELGLAAPKEKYSRQIRLELSPQEQKIYDHLNFEPLHLDALGHQTGFSTQELLVHLLGLEFKDAVRQLPGKYFLRMH
ncbi:MAG TPA: DNA-processing protein DprA [Patescibacteria group bacterium]|nr:DNA-processing protein DprA [Patescibacteria group bacterium]